jgi:subtilisin family serine protease
MSHGTHVAGIAGAIALNGDGVFGLVPDAQVDAIQISNELLVEGVSEGTGTPQQHVAFFMDAITDLAEYLDEQEPKPGERRVVNISLGYNWARANLVSQTDATADRIIRDQIRQHAKIVQFLVNRVQEQVLFVVAAGNDSDGLEKPFDAALASPFAFAALHKSPGFEPSANIIVVEAHDRDGKRASFSNTGGHVSAPGVDIMSILADNGNGVGVCSGTSQAAPHVAALASILFELSPSRKPADMIEIIRSTAAKSDDSTSAPRVDALAVASPSNSPI